METSSTATRCGGEAGTTPPADVSEKRPYLSGGSVGP